MVTTGDPLAQVASTAQGWVQTLNTAARPAPEHIEAAQAALKALARFGVEAWPAVQAALSEALEAARERVDGAEALRVVDGRPPGSITIAELRGALDELTALGLAWPQERADPAGPTVPRFVADGALARADQQRDELLARVTELEEALDEANERAALQDAELRRQVELRDRFEREAQQAHRELKAAKAERFNAVNVAREEERRAAHLWLLRQLGMNAPGFADWSTDDLRQAAVNELGDVQRGAAQLRLVLQELQPAWAALSGTERWTGVSNPIATARDIARMVEREARAHEEAQARLTELQDEVALAADLDLAGPHSRTAALAELTKLRRRIAELEAIRNVERQAAQEELADGPSATLQELRAVRAERNELLKTWDAQTAELRMLRTERDNAEHELEVLRGTAPEADQR